MIAASQNRMLEQMPALYGSGTHIRPINEDFDRSRSEEQQRLHQRLPFRGTKEKGANHISGASLFSVLEAPASGTIGALANPPASQIYPTIQQPSLLGAAQEPSAQLQSVRMDLLDFSALETAAFRRDVRSFVAALQIVNWAKRSPGDFAKATQIALELGAFAVAQELAAAGAREYSNDATAKRLARILAPARVVRSDLPSDATVVGNREWLKKHAAAYRKRWVALQDGKLLYAGESLEEVKSKLSAIKGVLLMRVP